MSSERKKMKIHATVNYRIDFPMEIEVPEGVENFDKITRDQERAINRQIEEEASDNFDLVEVDEIDWFPA